MRKIGTGSAIIIVGFAIGSVLEYGVKVLLARSLGPETYGVFVQGMAITQLAATIGLFGLQRGLPRFVSYFRGEDDEDAVEDAITTAGLLSLGGTAVLSIVLFMGAGRIATVFSEPALEPVLRLFAVAVLPLGVFYLGVAVIRGMQNARFKLMLTDVLLPVVEIILLAVLLGLGYGITGAVVAYTVAVIVAAIGGIYFFVHRTDYAVSDGFIPGRLLGFSWPLLAVSVMLVMHTWIDVIMLGWLQASVDVGVYEVAMALAGFLFIFLSSLNYMFMPVISELYAAGNIDDILDVYRTATRWIVTLILPLLAGFFIFPTEILHVLFGSAYTVGAAALAILAIGYFADTVVGPAGMILLATGRTKRFMVALLVLVVGDVIGNLILIPPYGMTGAAVAMTAGFVAANALMLWFAQAVVDGLPYTRDYLRPVTAIVIVAPAFWLLKDALEPSLPGSVAMGAALVLCYAAVAYLFGAVKAGDRELVEEWIVDR